MSSNIGKPIPDWELVGIDTDVVIWLNSWPGRPASVKPLHYPVIPADAPAMALAVTQGTYRTDVDILGSYEVEYTFKIVYRVKHGVNNDRSLQADETLNAFGLWLEQSPPDFSPKAEVTNVKIMIPSAYFATYENGDEDHQIFMRLTYRINGD